MSRYILGGEFARGGLGRILKAHDARLDRPVAVKELLSSNGMLRERFQREAAITARLQHPAIVPVYDSGAWNNGDLYYVMKLLSGGRTLKECVDDASSLDGLLTLLPNCIAIADAIAYAHSLGIIHRDLKPSNVLIGPFGETVVIDWGLAKDLSQPAQADELGGASYRTAAPDVTSVGCVLGTPHYMAPEQARGEVVDKRADVYALGAILYYVLSGQPPYSGSDARDVLRQVIAAEPIPVERRQPGVPQDLATIVHKAMARRPGDRYESAAELAADLKRFQTGQLVSAHRYSTFTLLARRVRKHRAAVAVAAVLLALLAATLTVSIRRIIGERNEARRQRAVAEQQRALTETARNGLILSQARSSLDHDPTATVAWLKTYPLGAPGYELVHDIAAEAEGRGVSRHVFRREDAKLSQVAFSPDGKRFAAAAGGQVRIVDTASGKQLMAMPTSGSVLGIVYSPDGRWLAITNWGSPNIRLWNLRDNGVKELIGHQAEVAEMHFSPDGRLLASGDTKGEVRLWNVDDGRARVFAGHHSMVLLLAFSPDGKLLATAGSDPEIRLWTITSGHCQMLVGHSASIAQLAFSPDGRTVASASWDGTIRLWSHGAGTSTVLRGHTARVEDVAFSPDGKYLASIGLDGTLRLWSMATHRGRVLLDHLGVAYALAFSPDGKMIAAGAGDGTVMLTDDKGEHRGLSGHRGAIYQLTFAATGNWLATSSDDRTSRVWRVEPFARELIGHRGEVQFVTISADGKYLFSGGRDNTARVWNLATGQDVVFGKNTDTVYRIAVSPDGRLIASAGADGAAWLYDLQAAKSTRLDGTDVGLDDITFSADGTKVAAAAVNGVVHVWSLAAKTHTTLLGHSEQVYSVRFLPDGEHLISGGQDSTVRLWDLRSRQSRVISSNEGWVSQVAISPTGESFASATWDGTLRLYDAKTLTSRALKGHEGPIEHFEYSPDGTSLVSASDDRTVRVWSTVTGKARVFIGHTDQVHVAHFIGGGLIASTGLDGTVRIWRQATGETVRVERPDAGHLETMAFSPTARILAYGGADRIIRILSLDSLQDTRQPDASWLDELTTAEMHAADQLRSP